MSCKVIAEVGQAHDGSLGTAHAYIDAAHTAGADGVKFQTHIAAAESTTGEAWRVKFSPQDATRYDYWKRMEFGLDQWIGLREHADELGLDFLSSPFSLEAVDLLSEVGVAAWKIASGEVSNLPLLERLATDGRPVVLSSGMSPWGEIERAVDIFRRADVDTTVLQCTSSYPCPPEQIGLNLLEELRRRFEVKVGLSDHSGTIYPGLAAATLGADLLEVHITFSRHCFGPDVRASLTVEEFATLTAGVRAITSMLANPVDKDTAAEGMTELRRLFTKSVVAARHLSAGQVLGDNDIAFRKPGTGISAADVMNVIGRRLIRDLDANDQILDPDLEPAS